MTQPPQPVPLSRLFDLSGKVAIVTGGGMGIGHGIVLRLGEAGAAVAIADVNLPAAQKVAEEAKRAGRKALAVQCDVSDEASVKAAFARVLHEFGRVDILVNNAGIFPFKPARQMNLTEWERVQGVNLRGPFLFSREFANQVAAQGDGGVIVNIGSIDSFHPSMAGLAAYDASKGGLLMLTRSLALELAPIGIRVNLIAPGGISTEGASAGTAGLGPEQMEVIMRDFLAKIPLGRMGAPDDIATVALFLASPASRYMTGASVVVDGGRLLS